MYQLLEHQSTRTPWNKGKLSGQKRPLKLQEIWAIRIRLQLTDRTRELALFNLAIDSKLRACDLMALRVADIAQGSRIQPRARIIQRKTGRPVQFEITEQTRDLLQTLQFFSGLIGLWVIWNDVLPAMQMLEDIRLWSYSVEAEGVRQVVPITLTNLLFAILITVITFIGARNLPGVLEITLLKYLPLDAFLYIV